MSGPPDGIPDVEKVKEMLREADASARLSPEDRRYIIRAGLAVIEALEKDIDLRERARTLDHIGMDTLRSRIAALEEAARPVVANFRVYLQAKGHVPSTGLFANHCPVCKALAALDQALAGGGTKE